MFENKGLRQLIRRKNKNNGNDWITLNIPSFDFATLYSNVIRIPDPQRTYNIDMLQEYLNSQRNSRRIGEIHHYDIVDHINLIR